MCERSNPYYYAFDILSDILSNGSSSRLTQRLVKDQQIFSSIDAYISGSTDAGLFHIAGKPAAGISLEEAELAINQELLLLQTQLVNEHELDKVKNKFEATQIFGNINYLTLATNLACHELIGSAEDIKHEVENYRSVTSGKLRAISHSVFNENNRIVLYYKKAQDSVHD